MLRSVYLKTLRDRWLGATVGVVSLFLIAWMGMWAFAGMGDEATAFIDSMPEAYLSLFGMTADAGVAGMMLSNMFTFMGPFVIAGIGVSMAASTIAGEESDGTMDVLGAMPRSRTRLLLSKAAAVATVVVASATISSLSYWAAAGLAGLGLDGIDLTAATIHMTVVALLFAAFALLLGASTGNRGLASGASVALIVVSFLVSGLLPLFEGWEDWAKVSPWYWIAGTNPLTEGTDWTPVLIIAGIALLCCVAAWWGVNHRDLNSGAVRAPMLDRLRADPRVGKAVSAVVGSGSTRGVTSKAMTDLRPVLLLGGLFVVFQGIVLGVMFNAISGDIGGFVEAMPDSILAMVGFADFSTPEGWYYGEMLTIVGPVVAAVVGINAGAALASEEKRRTIDALATLPLSRSAIAVRKAWAIMIGTVIAGALAAVGIAGGNAAGGLGLSYANVAASGLMLASLGVFLGAVAFVIGAATGRSSWAVGGATGIAIVGWGANSFLPVNPDVAGWARLSPFYWYGHDNPLVDGADWSGVALLLGIGVALIAIGVVAYQQRDLRS